MELAAIQQALTAEKLDGWLFYDFRQSNPIAYNVLSLSKTEPYTRRWFYFVPAHGTPTALVSAVESHVLHSLPGGYRFDLRRRQRIAAPALRALPGGGAAASQ